jgi:hypothetical protein
MKTPSRAPTRGAEQRNAPFAVITFAATLVIAIAVAIAGASHDSWAGAACHRTEFKTELIKQACATGGQDAAKAAMKKFVKEKKIKTCNTCHARLAPDYPLKPDALQRFHNLGGS